MKKNAHEAPSFSDARPPFLVKNVLWAKTSRDGYLIVGFRLAKRVRELVTGNVAAHVLEDLDEALRDHPDRDDRLWAWFKNAVPECMALVPSRRKAKFMQGVNLAIRAGEV